MNNILPIGTIISLKGSKDMYIIAGYCPIDNSGEYLYTIINFPEGITDTNQALFITQNDIDIIEYEGYKDETLYNIINDNIKIRIGQ